MTNSDFIKTKETLELIKSLNLVSSDSIAIHSPAMEQLNLIIDIFSKVPNLITQNGLHSTDGWDIMQPFDKNFDLLIFSNVLMYIKDPAVAFNNIFNSCKYLLIQDIILRDRGIDKNIFCLTDGDCMRYSFDNIKSNYDKSFDLKVFRDRILIFNPYLDNKVNLHFISLMKGNL